MKVFPIEIVNNDYTEYFDVAYNISNVCNYRCWYCGPEFNSGVDKFPSDIDLLTKNLDHFFNIYRTKFNKKDIRINLMGGEPTLWKDIEQFVKHYHSQNCRITMATNASRKMRWFNENARFFDDIHVSVHFQYCDPKHLIEVLDFLYYETDVLGNASILMDIDNWDKCKDIADQMIEHPTPWVFKVKPIIANGTLLPYNEEQLDYLREKVKKKPPQEYIDKQIRLGRIPNKAPNVHIKFSDGTVKDYKTFDFFENDWYHFYDWKCNAGVDGVRITPQQQILACGHGNSIGDGTIENLNLLDPNFVEKFTSDILKPTICKQPSCICRADLRLTKTKNYDR